MSSAGGPNVPHVTKRRDRGSNWTEVEKIIVVTNVLQREKELFGNFKGANQTAKDREVVWDEITDALNAESHNRRTKEQVKKLFDNIKQQAKKHIDSFKRPATGGGQGPAPPTVPQKLLLDHWKGRPGMEGIGAGIDTADPEMTSAIESTMALGSLLDIPEANEMLGSAISAFYEDATSSSAPAVTASAVKAAGPCPPRPKKRKVDQLNTSSYEDLERAEAERARSEARLANTRRIFEKRKLIAEIAYLNAKAAYWQKRTASLIENQKEM